METVFSVTGIRTPRQRAWQGRRPREPVEQDASAPAWQRVEGRGGNRAWGTESDCVGPACLERARASIPHDMEATGGF